MVGDENDTRFWLLHSTFGKRLIIIGLVIVGILVILKTVGFNV